MKCNAVNIYENLEYCPGETILPGLYDRLYAIPKRQIVCYPALPAVAANTEMSDAGTLDGDFTLAADAKFFRVDILDTASSLKSESQGERPSKTFLITLSVKYPGNNAAAAGFCRMANADDLLYIARQRDGQFRVVGNERFSTDTKPSQESGQAVTDSSGTTLEITCTDLCPAPFYTGKLQTDEGEIDCSTGKITVAAGA